VNVYVRVLQVSFAFDASSVYLGGYLQAESYMKVCMSICIQVCVCWRTSRESVPLF
jgi:hypothetical protein